MLPPIIMPTMHNSDSYRVKQYKFTLQDGSSIIKKLRVSIAAKEDKPRVNIFDDETFTVGTAPIVYQSNVNGDGSVDWVVMFQFIAVEVIYSTTLGIIEGGKGDKKQEEDKD
jgi:hypothetical protein